MQSELVYIACTPAARERKHSNTRPARDRQVLPFDPARRNDLKDPGAILKRLSRQMQKRR